jgi:pimeloyl-ACP methyl ester carboxylesterase
VSVMESRSWSTPASRCHGACTAGGIADAEKKGIRLIGYDRPGYGGSTAHPGYTVASGAQDVRAIAEALGHDRIGIWGISGRGPYALGCAACCQTSRSLSQRWRR